MTSPVRTHRPDAKTPPAPRSRQTSERSAARGAGPTTSPEPAPPPPKKVEVALGDRTFAVNVRPETEQRLAAYLADGDLTNDLARLAAADGDASQLSPEDFVASGFDPRQAALLAELSRQVAPFALDVSKLDPLAARAFLTVAASKSYLASLITGNDPRELSKRLTAHFAALPAPARDAALAGLAHETAMLLVRDELRFAVRQPGVSYVDAALRDPDRPLAQKHLALADAGVATIEARSTAVEAVRTEQLAQVRARARDVFHGLGGRGELGETITLATGSGITTLGLVGQRDWAIGLLDYGRPTSQSAGEHRGLVGLGEEEKRFTPTDWTRPVTFQLGVFGADPGFTGNVVTLQRRGADGQPTDVELTVSYAGGRTVLAPKDAKALPPDVVFDPRGQTLTFPPSAEPIRVQLRSGEAWGQLDELGLTLSAVNASSEAPSLTVELRELFEPGRFDVSAARPEVLARVHQQLDAAAEYVALHPELELGVGLAAHGPVDWSGQRPAEELTSYGPDGDRWSKDNTVDLRSSRLTVRFEAGKTGDVKVEASTDPVRATLSSPRGTVLTAEGRRAVEAVRARDQGLTDNDVLSGLRAFAVLELFEQKLAARGVARGVVSGRTVAIGTTTLSYPEYRAIAGELRAR